MNHLLLRPFVNYNMADGWYLVSAPRSVPVGRGVGKIFRVGNQPINLSLQAFGYPVRPSFGPKWAVRFQVQFLFPR